MMLMKLAAFLADEIAPSKQSPEKLRCETAHNAPDAQACALKLSRRHVQVSLACVKNVRLTTTVV
jgi:hypothetical protein